MVVFFQCPIARTGALRHRCRLFYNEKGVMSAYRSSRLERIQKESGRRRRRRRQKLCYFATAREHAAARDDEIRRCNRQGITRHKLLRDKMMEQDAAGEGNVIRRKLLHEEMQEKGKLPRKQLKK